MLGLIDGDILSYEIPFAAQTGWRGDGSPPFDYVQELLFQRIERIKTEAGIKNIEMYLTGKDNFRDKIATVKPYKQRDHSERPFHYQNVRVYMEAEYGAVVVNGYEADDAIAMRARECREQSIPHIVVSRDKDLRMIPSMFYAWEIGKQPSFGPIQIEYVGTMELSKDKKKLLGTGLKQFYGQMLTGDTVDNIPGLPRYGPSKAYKLLHACVSEAQLFTTVRSEYRAVYGGCWEDMMLEQGRLLWMVNEKDEDGNPVMWELPDLEKLYE